MASVRLTITLEDGQLEQVRKIVAAEKAKSVSGFIQHAVGVALNDMAGWGVQLAEAVARTGGPLTAKERAWADQILPPRRASSSEPDPPRCATEKP